MSRFAKAAHAAVVALLPAVRGGGLPLRAELRLAQDTGIDDEISFVDPQGRRHVVSVQVGAAYVAVNRSEYATRDLGDGMTVVGFDSILDGPMRRQVSETFAADLRAAFAELPDAYEPVAGPGLGTHPRLPDLVAVARAALSGSEATLALNPDGVRADGEDILAFLDADGARLPLEGRTAPGGYVVADLATGEVSPRFDAIMDRARAEGAMRAALAAATPAPAPGR